MKKKTDHAAVAAECRANPGQWQRVSEYGSGESAKAMCRAIRAATPSGSSRGRAYGPPGSFEARWEFTDRGALVEARYVAAPITDVETAVCEVGALPMPVGTLTPLTDAQRDRLLAELGTAQPASTALLVSLGDGVRSRREHAHPTWDDLFCLNLVSYMGERMGPVLRRLVDAETAVEQLRARVAELEADKVVADVLALAPAQASAAKYDAAFQTLELDLTATPEQWSAWQEALSVDLGRTTNRGSFVTSHATWRDLHVVVRCWPVRQGVAE